MAGVPTRTGLRAVLRAVDPRHSLMAGTVWLVIALAASFSIVGSIWVGRLARDNIVQQHARRLSVETDQLGSDLGQAVASRVGAVRASSIVQRSASAETVDGLRAVFAELSSAYPDLDWLAVADAGGTLVQANGELVAGSRVSEQPWFRDGLQRTWLGVISRARLTHSDGSPSASGTTPSLGDLALPLRDASGRAVGVIAAHLTWRWGPSHLRRLTEALDPRVAAQALVLDGRDLVLVGPEELRGKPWPGMPATDGPTLAPLATAGAPDLTAPTPRFERLPDGGIVLVARAPVSSAGGLPKEDWQVQLSETRQAVYRRADALAVQILWVSIGLAALTVLGGALGARHLTTRLKNLTRSVAAVGRDDAAKIEVPPGQDEVAQLARAFAGILLDLQRERAELRTLSRDLEQRVAARTREVERLAEEARYAAIVRERLKIARDLHDTLAHSMMAMLSEVRLLRRLEAHDPAALRDELARAEQVAHEGLKEARTAISQMRLNTVRDTGLGAALAKSFERFIDRTGLVGNFRTDAQAARFGDERAESIFRIAEEALRNIEHHASARMVDVSLRAVDGTHLELEIADDGVGFDTEAAYPGHFGLVGLREQAQLIGAQLRIESAPRRGTTVTLSLRMTPEVP